MTDDCTLRLHVDMKSSETWTIGRLASRLGRPTHVLRHWEAVGLLRPARDGGGRRRYGPDDLSRVAVIVRGKEAGIGLDELKDILDADPGARLRLRDVDDGQDLGAPELGDLDCAHGGEAMTCSRSDVVPAGPAGRPLVSRR